MKDKLLFVVTEDWYFVSHRLQLAKVALAKGYEVSVATRVGQHGDVIRDAGIHLIPFELSRRSGNPLAEILALFHLYRRERPKLIHHVAMKPVIFGSIAARLNGRVAEVNAIAGLGWLFTSSRWPMRLARPILRWVMARLLNCPHSFTIVQNTEDGEVLKQAGVSADHIRLIPGAGVDINVFRPTTNLNQPPCVMLVARMLWTKGVGEFVAAARLLALRGIEARFLLVGEPDLANPTTITEGILREWHGQFGVEWLGRREDIASVWQSAHIACLPSYYREGLPKCLLEAAACGLPIVTTDTPGCREVIVDGEEGILIPPKNAEALANAIERLICRPELRKQMGSKARERAIHLFSEDRVIAATLAIYAEALQ
jgi:glycosyltransferase involved in cell wall biosynthesis